MGLLNYQHLMKKCTFSAFIDKLFILLVYHKIDIGGGQIELSMYCQSNINFKPELDIYFVI